jgi:hypothetical protein
MIFATPVFLRILTTTYTPSTSLKARRAVGASTRIHRRVSMVLEASVGSPFGADGLETVLVELDRGAVEICLEMVNKSAKI